MLRIQILLLLLIGQGAFAQKIYVDTLKFPDGASLTAEQKTDIRFPIVKTGRRNVDSLINRDLKNRFTDNEFPDLPADSALIQWADQRIVYVDFELSYLQDGLISLNISAEGCGAHCTNWTDYFTYSTTTGKYVTIDEIVDTSGRFKGIVMADKTKRYEEQRKELKKMFLDKTSELDEESYQLALERYDECDQSFALGAFALFPDHLQIIEKCTFPNVMKNLTPAIELKYKYRDISKHLKIKH